MSDQLQAEREQVTQQCKAVAHMAEQIAKVHRDLAEIFNAGAGGGIVESNGKRTAALMEDLGDIMNCMDIVTEDDNWIEPIFVQAQARWPASPSQPSSVAMTDEPVLWIVECLISGKWVPQHPGKLTKEAAEEDAKMYKTPYKRVVPLVRALLQSSPQEASKPPDEQGDLCAKLHSTMDGQVWATEFCKLNAEADHGNMLGWFANAIMTGYDEAMRRRASQPSAASGWEEMAFALRGIRAEEKAIADIVISGDGTTEGLPPLVQNLRYAIDHLEKTLGNCVALTGAAPADANVGGLSDAEIVKAQHSLGVDTYPSQYGFTELQVSATSVPTIRKIVEIFLAAQHTRPTPTAPEPADKDAELIQFLEDETMRGMAPNLVFDDDGNWAVSYEGSQPMARGGGDGHSETVIIQSIVEPDEWRPSIREAIRAAIARMRSEPGKGRK